ncbi:hypothetical protein M422DRAFT_182355 [Sphaerobolus stellatus SS14]|uniref:Uncharacterized protein n=1 Tax=Sphaerobolus stellatus (strain SS14) TaxID=990650 RepID=A0A0C9VA44_SPHS4|nr:hypothetical protein M422DRAFT_182355 [Sphaerobolus stellatus SS14]
MHGFPAKLTTDTLSLFIVYMAHHIKPSSIRCYLSGICNSLESCYPNVCEAYSTPIICYTLGGMKKVRGSQPTQHKCALKHEDLVQIISHLSSPSHDNLLFAAMLLMGFYGLLRLRELTVPDMFTKCTTRKLTLWHTLIIEEGVQFSFTPPFHEADHFYTGSTVIIQVLPHSPLNPLYHLHHYIASRPLLPASTHPLVDLL